MSRSYTSVDLTGSLAGKVRCDNDRCYTSALLYDDDGIVICDPITDLKESHKDYKAYLVNVYKRLMNAPLPSDWIAIQHVNHEAPNTVRKAECCSARCGRLFLTRMEVARNRTVSADTLQPSGIDT